MSVRKFIYILLFCAPLSAFAFEYPTFEVTQKFVQIQIPYAREYSSNYGKYPTSGIKIRIWDAGNYQQDDGCNKFPALYQTGLWTDSIYQVETEDVSLYLRNAYYDNEKRGRCYVADDIAEGCDSAYLVMVEVSAYEVKLQLEYTGTPDWEFSHWQVIRQTGWSTDTIDTVFELQNITEQRNGTFEYENVAQFYIGGNLCTKYKVLSTEKYTTLIPIFKKVTAVERVEMPSYSIADGRVICEEEFRIYDLVGRDVTQLNGSLRGIYILKAGKATTKIIVP